MMGSIGELINNDTELIKKYKNFNGIFDMSQVQYKNLIKADLSYNKISDIVNLPPNLKSLYCGYNKIFRQLAFTISEFRLFI